MECLRLEGECTIYRAAELKPLLLDALKPSGRVILDLSGVSEIDSAGVQLLLLAKRQAEALSCEFSLSAPSPAVAEVFQVLDLHGQFGLQAAA